MAIPLGRVTAETEGHEVAEAHASFEAYKAGTGATTAHFHEKLLLLRDRLHTAAARRVAEGRHRFMEEFLARFHAEWEGVDEG